ncbi:MAG: cupin domain-containing protein [Spirochaetia bacterium]|jgi:(S)-ureidoglycine aminohydrolase|nr:cupin domain-containing protein [Spirochaetia bacterium]
MGYPNDILATRAVVKHGSYAVLPPEGLVNNVVPGIEGCRVSIVASPKMGASFVFYVVEAEPQGGTAALFGNGPDTETFVYIIEGEGSLAAEGKTHAGNAGSYLFSPAGAGLEFRNTSTGKMKALLYKQTHIPLKGHLAAAVYGNTNQIPYRHYDNMENVFIKDLLPLDIAYDMNMHILSFAPGGCHPFVETHVQEHGAYILEGEGCYLLDNEWRMIKKNDFVWFGPYVTQAAYGVGRTSFTYIYSKDCNRDAALA